VHVAAEWTERTLRTGGAAEVEQRLRAVDARTDARGSFRLCGVPRATPLRLLATSDGMEAGPVELHIAPGERLARAELVLDSAAHGTAAHDTAARGLASLAGVVLADSTRTPLAGVEVALPDLARRALTDDGGAFRLADIPPGTHRVLVRRLGYGPLDTTLAFAPNARVDRRVLLGRVTTLDSVIVSEQRAPALPDFEANRRLGIGRFLTRDDLAQQTGKRLSDVLRSMPGLTVLAGTGGRAWIASGHGQRSLGCHRPERDGEVRGIDPPAPCGTCYPHVYLDGVLLSRTTIPDVGRFTPDEIEAVEYYASAAQVPARYTDVSTASSASCGVLVLHTRRSP
jgi:hypothetical protein